MLKRLMLLRLQRVYASAVSRHGAWPRWAIWSALGLAALALIVGRQPISAGGTAGSGHLEIHLEPVPAPAAHDVFLGFAKPTATHPRPASTLVPARRRKPIQLDPVPPFVARESVEPRMPHQTGTTTSTEMPAPVEQKIEFMEPLALNAQSTLEFASTGSPLHTVPKPRESLAAEPTSTDSAPVETTGQTQAPAASVAPIQTSLPDPQHASVTPPSPSNPISRGHRTTVGPSWVNLPAKPIENPPTSPVLKPLQIKPLVASPLKGSHPIHPIHPIQDWTAPNATPATDTILTKGPLEVDPWIDSMPIDPIPAIDHESLLPVFDVASLGPPAPPFQESEWTPGPPLFAHSNEQAERFSLVPEPSTGLLLATGLALLGAAKRRR